MMIKTLLPFEDFDKSAKCLDNKRLNRQGLEVLQILEILMGEAGPKAWTNHPAILMWKGSEYWLVKYGITCCKEWLDRGFETPQLEMFEKLGEKIQLYHDNFFRLHKTSNPYAVPDKYYHRPDWLGDEKLHSSHRKALLFKRFDWYKRFRWPETEEFNVKNPPKPKFWWPSVEIQ